MTKSAPDEKRGLAIYLPEVLYSPGQRKSSLYYCVPLTLSYSSKINGFLSP